MITINELLKEVPDLSLEDYYFLHNLAKDYDEEVAFQKFIDQGILDSDKTFINQDIKDLLLEVVDERKTPTQNDLVKIAEDMREIFPTGKKEGTIYTWRCAVMEIVNRLKKLQSKFGIKIEHDKIIEATKRYVNSFNGNYQYMQILKYFIFKNKVVGDTVEFNSTLLQYLEDDSPDSSQQINSSWLETLK